ncbi:MAG: N-acetylmuramoyl-L-alanine amidase [Treponemataceae bacterium]|nr:MAG: N-acetylmuramoyl-L-alanine amidase [Treponemataceae bacterium]
MRVKQYVMSFLILCVSAALFAEADVNLTSEAQKTGASFFWDPLSSSGVIEKNGHSLSFRIGDSLARLDNARLILVDPPEKRGSGIYVTASFMNKAEEVFRQIVPERVRTSPESYYKIGAILIDAGHGGKDPGAIGTRAIGGKEETLKEKDITLQVSKLLAAKLRAAYPDKKIILTRDSDMTLTLDQRVAIANSVSLASHEAVLNISIHVNSSLDKKASGFEVWYLNPGYRRTVLSQTPGGRSVSKELFSIFNTMMEEEFTQESILIAKFIMEGLQSQIGSQSASRGIKQEEWFVVRNANMPSVLVEMGFLSNPEEMELLSDSAYLNKTASGIYNGIVNFVRHFEQSRGFTGQ